MSVANPLCLACSGSGWATVAGRRCWCLETDAGLGPYGDEPRIDDDAAAELTPKLAAILARAGRASCVHDAERLTRAARTHPIPEPGVIARGLGISYNVASRITDLIRAAQTQNRRTVQ